MGGKVGIEVDCSKFDQEEQLRRRVEDSDSCSKEDKEVDHSNR